MKNYILAIIERRSRHVTSVLVIAVFAVSGVVGLLSGDRLRYPDERDYDRLAQCILSGKGYVSSEGTATAYRPPGWPFVLSAIYRLFPNSPVTAKLLNALALASTAWLLSILVARITPEGRVFAPLLLLLYPVELYTASTLYPQTLGTVLLIAILLLLDNRRYTAVFTSVAGVLFGLLVLSIPAFLLVTPLILAGILVANRKKPSLFIGRVALLLMCATLVVAPWTVRNAHVLGGFIPVSTNSGVCLLLGNSENTGPNSGVNVDISRYLEEIKGMNETAVDARLRQFAVSWIRDNPRASAKLYFLKVLNYFNFRNRLYVKAERSCLRDVTMFLSYYPLLAVAIVRLVAHKRYRISPAEAMLYLLYFGNAFASAIFFTRIRLRVPFDALLIAIVAAFLGLLVRTINARKAEQHAGHGTV